jgi:hypothetical protein
MSILENVDPNANFDAGTAAVEVEPKAEAEKTQVVEKDKEKKALLPFRGGIGALATVEEQFRLATLYVKSRMLPARFTSPEQVLVASHFAMEHFPESPLTALRQIAVIEGVPSMFGDLPLAKVMKSKLLVGKEEYFVDKDWKRISPENGNCDAEIHAAVCTTVRKGGIKHTTSFSREDAKRAELWGKGTWKKYPQDMLLYRARARNLKSNFADALNGVGIGEYDNGVMIHDVESETQPSGVADRLNREFLGEANEEG